MIHWGVIYRFARSAAKHGISQERTVYVIEHCGLPFGFPEYPDTIMHLGDDERGVALEVGAVTADPETLVVIHAMRLRRKFYNAYAEALPWRI